jgi:hypothetical protein
MKKAQDKDLKPDTGTKIQVFLEKNHKSVASKQKDKHDNQLPCLSLPSYYYYFVASALISRNFLTHSSPPKSL